MSAIMQAYDEMRGYTLITMAIKELIRNRREVLRYQQNYSARHVKQCAEDLAVAESLERPLFQKATLALEHFRRFQEELCHTCGESASSGMGNGYEKASCERCLEVGHA